jgi:hypothetical protein
MFRPLRNLGNLRSAEQRSAHCKPAPIPAMYPQDVAAKPKLTWYGVRTLFRMVATGKPTIIDEHFDPTSTLVEDRVVLFRTDSFDSAIEQAEGEALNYCTRTRFVNIYGQTVRLKFLRAVDAYSVANDEPSPGCEVYSSTSIYPRSLSNADLLAQRFPKEKGGSPNRYKFVDGAILKEALLSVKPRRRTR